MGDREAGSRAIRHLKGHRPHRHEINLRACRFCAPPIWGSPRQRPRGAPRAHIAAPTATEHGPAPPQSHRRPLLGLLWVGWPLQWRAGTPRTPQRHQRGHSRPSAQQQRPAQTTAGGPPQRTKANCDAPQPPQGAGTSPTPPMGPMGGLQWRQKSRNRPVRVPWPGWVWPGSSKQTQDTSALGPPSPK